jgi:hypothetical protein
MTVWKAFVVLFVSNYSLLVRIILDALIGIGFAMQKEVGSGLTYPYNIASTSDPTTDI